MLEKLSCILIRYKYPLMGITLVLAVVFPFLFKSQYVIRIATIALMYVILALSLNMLSGMLGQMSFGHAAFFGIGAYTAAILCTKWAAIPGDTTGSSSYVWPFRRFSGYACTEIKWLLFYHCHYGVLRDYPNCGAELDERHQGTSGYYGYQETGILWI